MDSRGIRAAETSSTYSVVLRHLRITPGAVGLVIIALEIASAPTSESKTVATAAEVMQWAQGYSGCGGVSINGS